MAQRKSTPTGKSPVAKPGSARTGGAAGKRPAGAGQPGGKRPAGSSQPAGARGTATKATSGSSSVKPAALTKTPNRATGKPPARKPGKSIVNQKQRPWGLIVSAAAVVIFAAAVVIVVVATRKSSSSTLATSVTTGGQTVSASDPYRHAALPAAMAISGVTYRVEAQHNHVDGIIKYDKSPPVGGNHSQYWANCTGTVYDHQIANENAVHMLEHGAVWITYNPKTLSSSGLTTLKRYVAGVDRTALSPFAGLKTPISLQAWGYQLFVNSPTDSRIAQFIKVLKYNSKTTPEPGASCSDPQFNAASSRPGHPQD